MTAVSVVVDDLTPFATIDPAKAQAMIDDAMAMAARVAPCILLPDFAYPEAALALIRGAILRWHDSGTGAVVQQQAGPYGQTIDTKTTRRGMFWPSEITDLGNLCHETQAAKAFTIDTVPAIDWAHLPWCALSMGDTYCSCGTDIAGYPIFELD